MTALALVVTNAGLARFTRAQAGDPVDLTIARVGLTDQVFVAAPTLQALPGEARRVDTVSGEAVGDDVIHLVIRDDAEIGYGVRGFGLFFADGTLFASYASPGARIFEKSAATSMYLALDVAFPLGTVASLTFGDANFLNPPATTTRKGVVELATAAEADAGTAGALVITAALLARAVAAVRGYADQVVASLSARTITGAGLIKGGGTLASSRVLTVSGATVAEIRAGDRADVAVTPAALRGATPSVFGVEWIRRHPDGWIEQGGLLDVSLVNEAAFQVPFHVAFPTACVGCVAVVLNSTAQDTGNVSAQEVSLTPAAATFYAQNEGSSGAGNTGVRWRAIGY